MRVQITARNCDVPTETRERATDQIEKLTKYDPDLLSADLTFREEGVEKEVDAVLSIARADRVVATGSGEDFVMASDDLARKLGKILRRRRGQIRDRARSATGN